MRLELPRLPIPGLPKVDPPLKEETVKVGRRQLGIAHFGDMDGRLVIWHHGTPGARRQIPMVGRRAAVDLGFHIVCVGRPGCGVSTDHRYPNMAAWADDVEVVADHLGHERFAVVGLSGGGPYALSAAAGLPDRVQSAMILGGVCPLYGDDASGVPGGLIALAAQFRTFLPAVRPVLAGLLFGLLQPLMPIAHLAYPRVTGLMAEGDQPVFRDPETEGMFIDDIIANSRSQFSAFANDIVLFAKEWGFSLSDVKAPVRWWHGDADNFVPLGAAEHAVSRLPDAELYLRPGESHLGGFAVADQVLDVINGHWG